MIMSDFHAEQRKLRLQMAQNQVRMEIADEELERGGNPIATAAVLVVVLLFAASVVMFVLSYRDEIDGTQPAVSMVPCQRCHAEYKAPLDTYAKYAKYCGLSAAGKKQYLAELGRKP